jgi:hypothetical protein
VLLETGQAYRFDLLVKLFVAGGGDGDDGVEVMEVGDDEG